MISFKGVKSNDFGITLVWFGLELANFESSLTKGNRYGTVLITVPIEELLMAYSSRKPTKCLHWYKLGTRKYKKEWSQVIVVSRNKLISRAEPLEEIKPLTHFEISNGCDHPELALVMNDDDKLSINLATQKISIVPHLSRMCKNIKNQACPDLDNSQMVKDYPETVTLKEEFCNKLMQQISTGEKPPSPS